jgi:uncharacterized protein
MAEGASSAGIDKAALAAEKVAEKAFRAKKRRLFWMTQARVWHWISGAATLVGMILFAFTGITLNHAGDIEGKPKVEQVEAVMPADLLSQLVAPTGDEKTSTLPKPVADWLTQETGAKVSRRTGEWSDSEVYVGMPKPGGDAWLSIDRETGDVIYENTERGAISWLNDLHKGRNTGTVWFWFLDVFAVAAILFCISGLVLLWLHAPRRPITWFVVGAGLLLPAVIAIVFVHA